MSALLHQKIWNTLPEEEAAQLKEKIEETAQEKGLPLSNPIAPEEEQPDNQVMFQYFEWYLPDDGRHWQRLKESAEHLKSLGVGGVWMPPSARPQARVMWAMACMTCMTWVSLTRKAPSAPNMAPRKS